MQHKGFSMVEIIIALVVMQFALLSFFMINHSSNAKTMDAYYEYLSESLGEEVIDLCHGMGYKWAIKYIKHPDIFPLNKWHSCVAKPIFDKDSYFKECGAFERYVTFTPKTVGGNSILITVKLRVVKNSHAKSWLSRDGLTFSTLLVEEPQR